MGDEEELKELRAYKIGYDLGFYRGVEAMSDKIHKIADLVQCSATFKEIVKEAEAKGDKEMPYMFEQLMIQVMDAKTLLNELTPTLLVERKEINRLGKGIRELPREAFTDGDLSFNFIKKGEENGRSKRIQGDDQPVVDDGRKSEKSESKKESSSKVQQKNEKA